jgi:Glyoxalase-like domain
MREAWRSSTVDCWVGGTGRGMSRLILGSRTPEVTEWLVLQDAEGGARIAFQRVPALPRVTWPEGPIPQQSHLDLTVPASQELDIQHERVPALGGQLLRDRSDDPEEPLRVYADPEGHPFCIFVAHSKQPKASLRRCTARGGHAHDAE